MDADGSYMCCCHVVWSNHNTKSGAGYMDMLLYNHCNCIGICLCCNMERKVEVMGKRPIVSTLRSMKIDEEVIFGIHQRISLMGTIANRLDVERASGMSWKCKTDREAGIVTVKRVS